MAAGTGEAHKKGRGRPSPWGTRRGGDTLPGRTTPGALDQRGCPQTYPHPQLLRLLLIFLPRLLLRSPTPPSSPALTSSPTSPSLSLMKWLNYPQIPHSHTPQLVGGQPRREKPGNLRAPTLWRKYKGPERSGNLAEVAQQLSGRTGTGSQLS